MSNLPVEPAAEHEGLASIVDISTRRVEREAMLLNGALRAYDQLEFGLLGDVPLDTAIFTAHRELSRLVAELCKNGAVS